MATAELKSGPAAKIDVKKAAGFAVKYFHDLNPDGKVSVVTLEEVELSEDENYWLITLGYSSKETNPFGVPLKKYKVFKVDVFSGKVISMKIRKLE